LEQWRRQQWHVGEEEERKGGNDAREGKDERVTVVAGGEGEGAGVSGPSKLCLSDHQWGGLKVKEEDGERLTIKGQDVLITLQDDERWRRPQKLLLLQLCINYNL
jgi:hypothetical protein